MHKFSLKGFFALNGLIMVVRVGCGVVQQCLRQLLLGGRRRGGRLLVFLNPLQRLRDCLRRNWINLDRYSLVIAMVGNNEAPAAPIASLDST